MNANLGEITLYIYIARSATISVQYDLINFMNVSFFVQPVPSARVITFSSLY